MQKLRDLFRPIYYWFYFMYYYLLEIIFPPKIKNIKDIPIIINNFNRLSFLKRLIESLEKRGYRNIYIIDNASTYPPLLDFYNQCNYTVFRLNKNVGYLALWKTNIFKKFKNNFYVYTDPDVVLIEDCPEDFMQLFFDSLKEYKFARKVGFSLKIDNLPDCFTKKQEVIDWEKQYFSNKVSDLLFKASLDTTFALYRPRVKGGSNAYIPMYRSAYPYEVEHLPWYIDNDNLTEEELYYINHSKTSTMWTGLNQQKK